MFKIKKSAGVRVTFGVHRRIKKGNTARAQKNWQEAEQHYLSALDKDKSLTHIWVQVGHMRREMGDRHGAANAYVTAFLNNTQHEEAHTFTAEYFDSADQDLQDRAKKILKWRSSDENLSKTVFFDVTDLLLHFWRRRIPTGIQRIQSEVVFAALEESPTTVGTCVFLSGPKAWVQLPNELFKSLITTSKHSADPKDPIWQAEIEQLRTFLAISGDMPFRHGTCIVSLGSNWSVKNYFQSLENLKQAYDIKYIPFIHDLIPTIHPEFCVDKLVSDYNIWIEKIIDHAATFLANSESTKKDLQNFISASSRSTQDKGIEVVPLDARLGADTPLPPAGQANSITLPEKFVLLVSTIEPRKGHLLTAQAWKLLQEKHGADTPYLVCIGGKGWKADLFYDYLKRHKIVSKKIIIIHDVSDSLLFDAYRKCLCTVYPSLYEGWGLPVTESLCFGKVPVVADNSALLESGGDFAVYFKTNDAADLCRAIEKVTFDNTLRHTLEARIASDFKPREWHELARQILATVARVSHPD